MNWSKWWIAHEAIKPKDILLFSTLRNERIRLPFFLKYYRDMGVNHFVIVDNDSDDGSRQYLLDQPDVSLWTTEASYKRSRFGVDWLNWLATEICHGHWCLVVDPDEFLVYPFCDTRPLRALTDWLDAQASKALVRCCWTCTQRVRWMPSPIVKARTRSRCLLVRLAEITRSKRTANSAISGYRAGRARARFSMTTRNGPGAEQDPSGEMGPKLYVRQLHSHGAAARAEPGL